MKTLKWLYIFKKISKFWGGHGPPTLQHNSNPRSMNDPSSCEWRLEFFLRVCVTQWGYMVNSLPHVPFSIFFFFFFLGIWIQTFRHLLKLDKREDVIELTQNWGDQFKKLVIKWFYLFLHEHNICFKIMLGMIQQFW